MSRKRFIKLLMSCGVGRNQAVRLAELMQAARLPYLLAWIFVEWRLCNGEVH